jgi:PQQ-dependent catabolism-associated CXXCW motif protein
VTRPGATVLALALAAMAATAGAVEAPAGYRTDHYRAPVPASAPGAATVDTAGLRALLAAEPGAVLLDVAPLLRTAETDFDGTWIVAEERRNLPGSLWLPNVGHGWLDPAMRAYLERNLERATGGDRDRPLVVYCYVDCWMSWNAAKRAALELGYRRVRWYPEGTDGWAAAGLPLARGEPAPLDDDDRGP